MRDSFVALGSALKANKAGVAAFVAWMWQFPEARGGHEPVLTVRWLPDVHGGVEHRNLAPLLATTSSRRLEATTSTHVTRLADLILSTVFYCVLSQIHI